MMYHGTHKSNAVSIITNGFRPSSDGLLGAGIYISRNKQKAMCYPLNTSDNDRVVFKLRVRVGKVKKIDCNNHQMQKTWHQNGYDTAWVPPNSNISTIKSGREEDCVWDPKRITVLGISHCDDEQLKTELKGLIAKKKRASSRGKFKRRPCKVCLKEMKGTHILLECWHCKKAICPFLSVHKCNGK
ncbi:hypothetical protein NDU88_006100 [Pleurodeles waltl]|uniref:Poly [ADP-ribose] polymerase n=2 Tax=Pleurodeles waltl TaxID=8319 RepID=A0AAV7UK10_PLEWA|nr:hypothetical protein NDU88_006100 [Pleurodeles waltl]